MVTESVFADPHFSSHSVTGLIKKRSKYFLLERSVLHAHATISQGENQNIEWQLDRVIGYDVFDKFIQLLLQIIMGAFFAPHLVISGAKLYFLGAVLPFALVYFRRWLRVIEHHTTLI